MQACRDGDLGLPFQGWIDPEIPLGDQLRLIPRAIQPGYDLLAFLSALVSFGGMGGLLGYFAWRWHAAGAGDVMTVLMLLIAMGMWAVPLVLGRRWWRSWAAAGDQRRGRLRQGILLGADGVLVRMEPHTCYAITWDRYLGVKQFRRSAGSALLQIETLDGPINFPSHWLRTTLSGFEEAVEQLRPVAGRHTVVPQGERQTRVDPGPLRKLWQLIAIFLVGCVIVLASFIGVITTKDQTPVHDWSALGVFIGLLWTLGTVPFAIWTLYRLSTHVCAECGKQVPRADEFRPQVVFYCASCGINWDTQMTERKMPR